MNPFDIEEKISERLNAELPQVRVAIIPDYGAEEVLRLAALHEDGSAFIQYIGTQFNYNSIADKISFAVFVGAKGYSAICKRLREIKVALQNYEYEYPYRLFLENDAFDIERNGTYIYTINFYTLRKINP